MAAMLVVVSKETGRLVFVRDASYPHMLHSLWSPVTHNYLLIPEGPSLGTEVRTEPWNFMFVNRQLRKAELQDSAKYALDKAKAETLCALVRAVNRHRRVACKEDILGQSRVYTQLVEEAREFKKHGDNGRYRFLAQAAEIDQIKLAEAASLVLMQNERELEVLLDTEFSRRTLERAILAASTAEALAEVERRVLEYERNG